MTDAPPSPETPLLYLENVAKVVDVDADTVLLCDPKVETFSRRAGLARDAGKRWGCIVCKVLDWAALKFFGQKDHCTAAVQAGEVE